ncbi:MAG: tRNA-dihydrouridine synthase family protein [Coriobacteriales bacterium]|nr:tRNA-dihydrouridine synthase family protein [Coriobacteriales bacterium]
MAGVGDPVFRGICASFGADLTYTEMVSAKGLAYGSGRTEGLLASGEGERRVAVQLFGREPEVLAEQARRLESRHRGRIGLIDVNMGCPARKVAGKGEGAALMREPALAGRILRAVVESVSLPVTVKFRKGYELGEDSAVEFARMAESCGVAAVTVHGRTARQLYHGQSDREVVSRVVQAVAVPVIASGDVFTCEDIREYRERHGARAVMVARGARGNPWIFSDAFSDAGPTTEERVRVAHEHTVGLARLAPHRLAGMRRHIAWYFKGTPHAGAIRRAVCDCACLQDYEALLEQILAWR